MGLDWLRPGTVTRTRLAPPRTPDGRVDLVALARAGARTVLEAAPGVPGSDEVTYAVIGTAGALVHDGLTTRLVARTGATEDLGADAFAAIDRVTTAMRARPDDSPPDEGPPFVGGLAGALSYDLGRLVEPRPALAADDRHADWLDLRVVTDVVAVDHGDETAWRIQRPVVGLPDDDAGDAVLARWSSAPGADAASPADGDAVTTSLPLPAYRDALGRVAELIAAGQVFQVNLTQRLTSPWPHGALALWERLREASPAPHGALLVRGDDEAIASVSQETFLAVRGRRVRTRPIKGTRPRGADRASDRAAHDELVGSAKDRAENVMVVDMERNDLGRVCRPGTVRTHDLLRAEPHPTVWQLVSTVEGELADGVGWGTLLAATFPSGSVTGTPKVRAMQVIEELEPVRRSWYCGAIGWIGPGAASLSVAIRTAVLSDGRVDYAAGGGIVADSVPELEIAESWAKAAAFLSAVGARAPDDPPEVHA